jgi:hypothetical protein
MTPADFTLDFFKLCLSQHVWGWRDLVNAFDRQKHSVSEDFLLHIAYTNGQEFIDAFNAASPQQTFPFNLTEKPNTKPKTNMTPIQLTINVPEFEKLADAINRLADNLANPLLVAPSITTTVSTCGGEAETPAATEASSPAPAKKRGRPAKAESAPAIEEAPAPVAPEPAPAVEVEVEVEVEPALPELTGVDLARKAAELFAGEEPIKVEMRKKLVDFRTNALGWEQPISKLTDQALLYQFNEKIDELADEMAALAASAKEEEV